MGELGFIKEVEQQLAKEVNEQLRNENKNKNRNQESIRRKRRRSKRRRKRILLNLLFVSIITFIVVGFFLYQDSLVYKVCRVEVGGIVTPMDFLKKVDENAYFTKKSEPFDTTKLGEYKIKIKTGIFTVSSTLYVQDTVAPTLEVKNISMTLGETCGIEDFVVKLEDRTDTKLSFRQAPDFSKIGKQQLEVIATDLGGNIISKNVQLWIIPVLSPIYVELGSEVPAISELVVEGVQATYVSDPSIVDVNMLGTYTVIVEVEQEEYTVEVIVRDTIAPSLEVQSVTGYSMIEKKPEEFVTSCADLTNTTITYKEMPNFEQVGEQKVIIVATDESGNQTEQETTLVQMADEEPPVFSKAKDFIVYLGETVSYKSKVTVTDNCMEGLTIDVDASAVDLKKEGRYSVIYTATDMAGNSTSKKLTVTVKEYRADEDALYEKVNALLDKILTDDMTEREKCQKIYNYIRGKVSYISYSDKSDWVNAAMEGLNKGKGDCFVYFSLSKAMLTCAGFPNLDIERIRVGDSMHFWNLVDLGDGHGWYHFDTTPRKDKTVIFLWDDTKLKNYSDKNNGSHNYDRAKYPKIN